MKRHGYSRTLFISVPAVLSCLAVVLLFLASAWGGGSGEGGRQQSWGNLKQIGMVVTSDREAAFEMLAYGLSGSNVVSDVSAERVFATLLKVRRMPPSLLLTSAYRVSVMPGEPTAGNVLEKYGASYYSWMMSREKWEQACDFCWRSPRDARVYDFPILWDKKPELYGETVSFLMPNGSVSCLPADEFTQYKNAAVEWLIPSRLNTADLLNMLKGNSFDEKVRAIRLLGVRKDSKYLPAIVDALQDGNGEVRIAALWALGSLGSPDAVPHMSSLVKDSNVVARGVLADALGRIGGSTVVAPLAELVKDKDRSVRRRALAALGLCKASEAIRILLPALDDEEMQCRQEALESLRQLGWTPPSRPL